VSVPGADELFRRTVVPQQGPDPADPTDPAEHPGHPGHSRHPAQRATEPATPAAAPADALDPGQPAVSPGPSGRIRHEQKMTVYLTAGELVDLEQARLSLRRSGLTVDRGRLVREAVAIALADLAANGDDSVLVHRLTRP
jgi:hypothetical protein